VPDRLTPSTPPLVLALLLASGCAAAVSGTVPARGAFEPTGDFRAGAATVDITPVPGMPTGGHSVEGRIARGYWTRLRARAIHLEDAGGRGFVLIAADLWSVPRGLADRVAELLATHPDLTPALGGRRLGREQIVLAATHTHHGPAAYSTDPFFTLAAGAAPGFDRALFEFLAARIARAAADAIAAGRPARVTLGAARVPCVFRNRSLDAFRANPEAPAILAAQADLPLCSPAPLYPEPEACRAVDARVAVLRIERIEDPAERAGPAGGGRATGVDEREARGFAGGATGPAPGAADPELVAAAVFLAVHPTVVSHDAALYGADLFGAVATRAERALAARQPAAAPPVVAVLNGAEGDVSATWVEQGRADVLRLSGALAEVVTALARGEDAGGVAVPCPDGTVDRPRAVAGRPRVAARGDGHAISFGFELAPLAGQRVDPGDGRARRTARMPMPGKGTTAGAEDGRSWVPAWLSREGMRGVSFGPHGAKLGAFDPALLGVTIPPLWLTRLALAVFPPEREVAIGVYALGRLRLATLPGEATTAMGRRVAHAVAAASGAEPGDVLLIGLAHSYAYYFATPEEYERQHYEGSGTLYGTYAGAHVAARLGALAAAADAGPSPPRRHEFHHRPGIGRRFGLARVDTRPDVLDAGTRDVVAATPEDAPIAAFPRFCWADGAPSLAPAAGGDAAHGGTGGRAAPLPLHRVTPRVAIEAAAGGDAFAPLAVAGVLADDEGLELVTLAMARRPGPGACWCAHWMPPAAVDLDGRYRFAVARLRGGTIRSRAFDLRDPGTFPGEEAPCSAAGGPAAS
jgi:neutral ceramidase